MRMTFNNNQPDALTRVRGAKKPGRKHNHQPRGKAHQKMLQRPINRQRLENGRRKAFNAKVRAYWVGQADAYPA